MRIKITITTIIFHLTFSTILQLNKDEKFKSLNYYRNLSGFQQKRNGKKKCVFDMKCNKDVCLKVAKRNF